MPELSPPAAAEWKRIVPQLMQLGVLTSVDGKALAAYCYAFARWQQAERDIKRYGLTIREPILRGGRKTKYVRLKSNPAIRVAHEAMKIMKSFLIEFGMTPASRTRVATFTPHANENDPKPANAADQYFTGPSHSIQ